MIIYTNVVNEMHSLPPGKLLLLILAR